MNTHSAHPDRDISIPLSALEHYAYCPRQAGLIHLDQVWAENTQTVRGDLAHAAVDLPGTVRRRGVHTVRSLPVSSRHYGIHGVCDVVEFHTRRAHPVEYKIGRYRPGAAEIQLAGQALCLQEAGFEVETGSIFSMTERRRHRIPLTDELIDSTVQTITRMYELLVRQQLPAAVNDRRCRGCSLRDDCLPELTHSRGGGDVDLFTIAEEGIFE